MIKTYKIFSLSHTNGKCSFNKNLFFQLSFLKIFSLVICMKCCCCAVHEGVKFLYICDGFLKHIVFQIALSKP